VIRARSSFPYRLAAAGIVALVGATLAGCSATNPITTARAYSPSDGVRATLGDITAENLLVLTSAQGAEAALQGALTNRGATAVTVSLSSDTGAIGNVTVGADHTVLLGGADGTTLTFTSANAPGALDPVTLATGPGGTLAVSVPVLDGTLPEYATLVPTPTPSSATPGGASTGSPAPTGSPTPSAG
jgi:hypothetical protein